MRVVLDTNVLLCGLLTRGICEAVLDACLGSEAHTVVISPHILQEFADQVERRFKVPAAKARTAVDFLRRQVEFVEPLVVPPDSCRDLDDLPVLGTLSAAKADCLVTGDQDLLSLGDFQGAPILSPRTVHARLLNVSRRFR